MLSEMKAHPPEVVAADVGVPTLIATPTGPPIGEFVAHGFHWNAEENVKGWKATSTYTQRLCAGRAMPLNIVPIICCRA